MITFGTPSPSHAPKPVPVVTTKKVKQFSFDPESDLPNNITDCDELADKLWDTADWNNYAIVAEHANKLVGWKRWSTAGTQIMPTIRIGSAPVDPAIIIGDPTPKILELYKQGLSIRKIKRELGITMRRIKKYLAKINIYVE